MKQVPTVNIQQYTNGSIYEQSQFVQIFGSALKEYGFVIVEGHDISTELIKDSYKQIELFFNLSSEKKQKYLDSSGFGQRGYIAFGSENAKNSSLKDLKEFFHVGRSQFQNLELKNTYPSNIWPKEAECNLARPLEQLYGELDKFSQVLLCGISEFLNLPKNSLAQVAQDGNTILRALHYPPISNEQFNTGAVRAAAHEDINLITILCEATNAGLQILTREGNWLDVETKPGQMVIDAGDMLALMTNDVIPSTTHRVINPPHAKNISRYSMPFFVHAYGNYELKVLENCKSPSYPAKYAPILADAFLKQRLYEIGFSKK